MTLRFALFLCCLLAATVLRAGPTNRYVSLAGGNVSPYDSWDRAGTSIKTVVDYANTLNEGDTVWVSNGVHNLAATISVLNTIVKSFNTNLAGTIVNGAGAYRCFYLNHANAWVEGVTISNGYLASTMGAGVHLNNGTVTNCTVRNCIGTASVLGGGFVIYTGLVANCTIASNAAGQGGGVAVNGNKAVVSNCTISGNTGVAGGGFYFPWGATTTSIVYNCDICYNYASFAGYYSGGGIIGSATVSDGTAFIKCRIYGNTAAGDGGGSYGGQRLQDCIISNNVAGNKGGGIGTSAYMVGPIINCVVVNNVSSSQGGGMYIGRYRTVVSNCLISANTSGDGGGASLYYPYEAGARIDFYNCLIANNVATTSGAGVVANFFATVNPITFQNCTIVSNRALGASGVGGMWVRQASAMATFVNVIAYFNEGAGASNWLRTSATICFSNSCTAPTNGTGFIGSNNTALDPQFTGPVSLDYHLLKGSPCINTGLYQDWMANAVDLDGRPRIREGTVDMGAFEYFPQGAVVTFR